MKQNYIVCKNCKCFEKYATTREDCDVCAVCGTKINVGNRWVKEKENE